jgi:hypothetical protein
MGKKRRNQVGGNSDQTDWSGERTLADVEAEELAAREEARLAAGEIQIEGLPLERNLPSVETANAASASSAKCACGSEEFLLEAYLAVISGRPQPEPVELESLTCPQCGREYEAIWLSDGRVARGEYRGQTDLDD